MVIKKKKITIQRIKFNFNFYLNVAKKAMDNNDHQTALLIRIALDDLNIRRLKLKLKDKNLKILKELKDKYGDFDTLYAKHFNEMIYSGWENEWLPSSIVIQTYRDLDKMIILNKDKFFKQINKNLNISFVVNSYLQGKYNQYRYTEESLCSIYKIKPEDMEICKEYLKSNGMNNVRQLIYNLSMQVKKKNIK